MANLNVLPQVSGKPQNSNSDLNTDAKVGQNAELSKEFQANLNQAGDAKAADKSKVSQTQNQATLDLLALHSSEKEASEKAAQAALLAAGTKVPVVPVLQKGTEVKADQNAAAGLQTVTTAKGESFANSKAAQLMPQVHGQPNAKQVVTQQPIDLQSDESALENQEIIRSLNRRSKQSLIQNEQNSGQKLQNGLQGRDLSAVQNNANLAVSAAMQSINGASIDSLSDKHAFNLESLEVKDGSSFSDAAADARSRVPSSKLSTSDYMNLRDLSQNVKNTPTSAQPLTRVPNKEILSNLSASGVGMKAVNLTKEQRKGASLNDATSQAVALPVQHEGPQSHIVEAPVTQGSNQKMVLSHDALHQITHQVNHMSQAKQDGEIKIRLRPDHLGELQMSVRTQGQSVSIQIKAQDGEAKKIIEESLSSLRESLSNQNLTLGRVDVVTQPQQTTTNDSQMQMDLGQFRQNRDQASDQSSQQGNRQDRLFDEGLKPANLNMARMSHVNRSRSVSSGGLDMIA